MISSRTYRSRVPRHSRGAFLTVRFSVILVTFAVAVLAVGLIF